MKEYKKVKGREYRKKYDISQRPGDNKVGTGLLHGKPEDDEDDEKREIEKECKRLGLKTVEEKLRIMACE